MNYDEHRNPVLFFPVLDTWQMLLEWQRDSTQVRPHRSLWQIPLGSSRSRRYQPGPHEVKSSTSERSRLVCTESE